MLRTPSGAGAPQVITVDEQLRLMRKGYKATLQLKYGDFEVPVRLITAGEEASLVAKARARAKKAPDPYETQLLGSLEVMKAVLEGAGQVDGTPYLSRKLLDQLTNPEIENLYDQYTTLQRTVNPEFEALSGEKIAELIQAVKKNETTTSDLSTWQRAEIGRFFLDQILPRTGNEAGS
jgi:hypothetical protein